MCIRDSFILHAAQQRLRIIRRAVQVRRDHQFHSAISPLHFAEGVKEAHLPGLRQIAERGVDLVVDYEHQTLTGDRAPAAGWVKELFAEDGHIKARVEWTLPAKQYLENKEYRYLSPVITVRKSDNKATGLHSLALTNTPGLAGMTPIVN